MLSIYATSTEFHFFFLLFIVLERIQDSVIIEMTNEEKETENEKFLILLYYLSYYKE